MLYTGDIRVINPSDYDEVWIITRRPKGVHIRGNMRLVQDLAPSEQLLFDALSWQRKGIYEKKFETDYKPRFLKEMENEKAQLKLNELYEKSRKKDIMVACFCTKEQYCHRSLVKELIKTLEQGIHHPKDVFLEKENDYAFEQCPEI